METPVITLYGKTYAPKPPKMKVWRRFLAFFDEDKKNLSVEEFLDAEIDLILLAFDREEVTREAIDDNIEVAKLVKLPNDEAGKA